MHKFTDDTTLSENGQKGYESDMQRALDAVLEWSQRSSRFHCHIGVINKPTTDELWISPVYRRLAVAKFSKSTM